MAQVGYNQGCYPLTKYLAPLGMVDIDCVVILVQQPLVRWSLIPLHCNRKLSEQGSPICLVSSCLPFHSHPPKLKGHMYVLPLVQSNQIHSCV